MVFVLGQDPYEGEPYKGLGITTTGFVNSLLIANTENLTDTMASY
jgi:hypothetical protein